jgi:hypothetical protein
MRRKGSKVIASWGRKYLSDYLIETRAKDEQIIATVVVNNGGEKMNRFCIFFHGYERKGTSRGE